MVKIRSLVARGCAATLLSAFAMVGGIVHASAAATPADQWLGIGADGSNSSSDLGEHILTPATAEAAKPRWALPPAPNGTGVAIRHGMIYYARPAEGSETPTGSIVHASLATGATISTITLPTLQSPNEISVSGTTLVVAFRNDADFGLGGVDAFSTTTHKLLWTVPSLGFIADHLLVAGGRVYFRSDAGDGEHAYAEAVSLATGRVLWQLPGVDVTSATSAGVWVTGYDLGGPTGYVDGATGALKWIVASEHPGYFVGGTVITVDDNEITAFPAAGCNTLDPTTDPCPSLWTREMHQQVDDQTTCQLGGADATSFYLTCTKTGGTDVGYLDRVDAASGRILASSVLPPWPSVPVRGGSVVWVCTGAAIVGFDASKTGAVRPVATLANTNPSGASPLGDNTTLAVADGALIGSTTLLSVVGSSERSRT